MPDPKPPTQQAIADVLGVTKGRIWQLKQAGMPVHNMHLAVEWYRSRVAGRKESAPPARALRQPRDEPDDGDGPEEYQVSRARREAAEADIAELKASELRGDMVRQSLFLGAQEKKANMVREAVLQLPAQLAPVLAAEGDVARCQDLLQDACHNVLTRISA